MRTIASIQALRAFAALSVVICHYCQIHEQITGQGNTFLVAGFSSGVDLFFVISGFIIVYASEPLFQTRNAASIFLSHRIARVVPLYWLATLAALLISQRIPYWRDALYSALFIPYHDEGGKGAIQPLYGVGWTLNYEMFFYVLFSLFIGLPRRVAVPVLCALMSAIVMAGHVLRPTITALELWSDPLIFEFIFGMIIALLVRHGVALSGTLRVLMILAGVSAIWLSLIDFAVGYRALEWGVPAAMIVAGGVLGPQQEDSGPVADFAILLGDASYAMYLVHVLIGAAISIAWQHGLSRYRLIPLLACGVVMVIGTSILIHKLFERPVTRLVRRFLQDRLVSASSWAYQSVFRRNVAKRAAA